MYKYPDRNIIKYRDGIKAFMEEINMSELKFDKKRNYSLHTLKTFLEKGMLKEGDTFKSNTGLTITVSRGKFMRNKRNISDVSNLMAFKYNGNVLTDKDPE